MLQAMLRFFFYLPIRALAQQILAVSEFNHWLSVALLNVATGTSEMLTFLSKTKTAPAFDICLYKDFYCVITRYHSVAF